MQNEMRVSRSRCAYAFLLVVLAVLGLLYFNLRESLDQPTYTVRVRHAYISSVYQYVIIVSSYLICGGSLRESDTLVYLIFQIFYAQI